MEPGNSCGGGPHRRMGSNPQSEWIDLLLSMYARTNAPELR